MVKYWYFEPIEGFRQQWLIFTEGWNCEKSNHTALLRRAASLSLLIGNRNKLQGGEAGLLFEYAANLRFTTIIVTACNHHHPFLNSLNDLKSGCPRIYPRNASPVTLSPTLSITTRRKATLYAPISVSLPPRSLRREAQ